MELKDNFDTNIQELLEMVNNDTIFLSDWNKSDDILNFNIERLNITSKYHSYKNIYFFSDEFDKLKQSYGPYINNKLVRLPPERFAIVSNCTAASFLCLYYILREKGKINSLILAPTYFSYIKTLQDFHSNIFFIDCYNNNNVISQIVKNVKEHKINTIIVTEPLFGTGVSLPKNIYNEICKICNNNDIFFLIDYSYGGMKWNDYNCEQDNYFINLTKYRNVILVESICKRIFLNGIKHGIIIADSNIIKTIEEISVYSFGCLSEQQILLYKQLYKLDNRDYIINTINKNNMYYRNNYHLIITLLSGTSFHISSCDCGYFCLIGIPKNKNTNSLSIAKRIINETNILTIPHDRYIFNCNKYYYFRVNLAVNHNKITNSINGLLQTYFDGIN